MSNESKSWYLMTRPLFNSGYENDEMYAFGQDGFQELLYSAIGCDVQIYDKRLRSRPRTVRAIIQNTTSDVFSGSMIRQILCPIGNLHCGQYIKIDDAYWLVAAYPDNNQVYEKAVLWKCKYTIKFVSPLTGKVVEYPVHDVNSTQYGTGELEKRHITVGESQHLVYIPYNRETILVDDRFRFIMDKNRVNPTVYRVTQVDPISYSVGSETNDGLIQWSVLETPFNTETDNKELMVADYYRPDAVSNESVKGEDARLILKDRDGDLCITIGEEKQIEVICIRNRERIEDFQYTLTYDLADGACELVQNGNLLTLRAVDDTDNIGKTVEISATSNSLDTAATMKIQIVGW